MEMISNNDLNYIIKLLREAHDDVFKEDNIVKSKLYACDSIVIRKLFTALYGIEKTNMIENHIYSEKLTFNELVEKLNG